ncbi:MAG: hypothetical protein V3T53_04735 [Phycisphaerales bacterium]
MSHIFDRRMKLTVLSILTPLLGMAGADGSVPPEKRAQKHDQPLETYVEPSIRSIPGPRLTAPPAMPTAGGFISVQVNVDEFGDNILNDAANEPSIAVDPTAPNRMVIGWRQFDTVNNSFRQGGWGYSNDGGRSWTFPGVLEPGVFRSDPVLDFDAEGNFYYNSLSVVGNEFSCQVFKSVDGGATWGDPVWAWGGDKQWMVIDRTGGIGHGNIYANWTVFFSVCDGQFTRSYDGGDSFLECIDVPGSPQWGTLAIGPDGELYIAGDGFVVVKSSTMQDEFEPPSFDFVTGVDLTGTIVFGGAPNPGGLSGQAWIATDISDGPMRGNVYLLCSVDPPGSDPLDVIFSRSTDGGMTWSNPVRVNDDPNNNGAYQWFGTMSVAPNGRIDAIWNDTRNSGQANMSELFYSSSTDGGVTWSTNTQLSPVFNSWIGWPQQNKIGDYYDMISDDVGANLAWAATFNGEQDVYYLRIGDYDCNGNGVGDTEDLKNGDSADCNKNGIPDECEIAAGTLPDKNGNGIPDECEIPGDLDGDGTVGANDLLILLASWGPCDDCDECPADLNGDCTVGAADLLILLVNWG